VTILAFPDLVKAPADIETVALDWSAFAPSGQSSIATHSVAVKCGDVGAADAGVSALTQKVTLSGGTCGLRSIVEATVAFADGTSLTRGFDVVVK
jgi:hypothetical protein